jgi:tetratricopeptide (TPR) repeat protein/predicted aspartyl protease
MLLRRSAWIAVLLAAAMSTATAANRCKLLMSSPLPVTMEDLRPVITAQLDGVDAHFMLDTGSFFDFLSPAAAAQFKLPLSDAPPWYYVSGVGGSVIPQIATGKTFSLAGITAKRPVFLVDNNDFGGDVVGLLGQNLLRITDVEFDFANGALRFVKPQHCGDLALAYWATPAQFIGEVDVHWTSQDQPDLLGKASVNGHDVKVLFDTGSARSILSLAAAKRAGITPESPGVAPAGDSSGIGKRTIQVWSAPVDRFEIGGEAIEHTHLLIGDINLGNEDVDMLLGSDFFLSHHIYVAYSQDKVYFTYNGGPVFDLNARRPAQTASAPKTSQPGAAQSGNPARSPGASAAAASASQPGAPSHSRNPAGSSPAPGAGSRADIPTDAAGFMRRGMAEISRREFSQAIVDLTRACDLAAADADCRYRRGLAYWHNGNPRLALADFDEALKLSPGDYAAHLARAELQFDQPNSDVEDDLDAVDRLAPPEADLRMHLASLYGSSQQYTAAAHQLDLWIQYHPADIRLPSALGLRCWARAAANVQLDQALADCNRAVHTKLAASHSAFWRLTHQAPPGPGWILSNRSLVYLRLGDLDKAIADDDAALAQIHSDDSAYPRYLRGIAELRKGLKPQGQADLAAARKLQPDIDKHYASMGLTP